MRSSALVFLFVLSGCSASVSRYNTDARESLPATNRSRPKPEAESLLSNPRYSHSVWYASYATEYGGVAKYLTACLIGNVQMNDPTAGWYPISACPTHTTLVAMCTLNVAGGFLVVVYYEVPGWDRARHSEHCTMEGGTFRVGS
jgi:hypothetical protein